MAMYSLLCSLFAMSFACLQTLHGVQSDIMLICGVIDNRGDIAAPTARKRKRDAWSDQGEGRKMATRVSSGSMLRHELCPQSTIIGNFDKK